MWSLTGTEHRCQRTVVNIPGVQRDPVGGPDGTSDHLTREPVARALQHRAASPKQPATPRGVRRVPDRFHRTLWPAVTYLTGGVVLSWDSVKPT